MSAEGCPIIALIAPSRLYVMMLSKIISVAM